MRFPTYLRIAIVTHYGVFQVKKSQDNTIEITGGLEAEFLKLLSEKLKFRYSIVMPQDMEWGNRVPGGNWTGIMGLLARNAADIGISVMATEYNRLKTVDFSYPYYQHEVTFATKPPGLRSREIAMFLPFSVTLWTAILVAILLETVAFRLLLSRKYALQDIFFFAVGCILNGTKRIRYDTTREKVLIGPWLVGSLVISLSYVSLLLSFLTIPLKQQPISDRYELVDAIRSGSYKVVVQRGSLTLSTLLNSREEYTQLIGQYIVKNNWIIPPGIAAMRKVLKEDRVAAVGSRTTFLFIADRYVSEDLFSYQYTGIAMRKDFCCKRALDTLIHRISAACLYEKKFFEFIFKFRLKSGFNAKKEADPVKPLMFQELAGAFIILFSGYVLGGITLVLEFLAARRKKK